MTFTVNTYVWNFFSTDDAKGIFCKKRPESNKKNLPTTVMREIFTHYA